MPLIVGERFGRLIAVCEAGRAKNGAIVWRFKCDCGSNFETRYSRVASGNTVSCGCYRRDKGKAKEGIATRHGLTGSSIYGRYYAMIQRCENPNDKKYSNYGGRGITVCDRWRNSFESFVADMGMPPAKHSIDREDNDGNYEPSNCRWLTIGGQNRNKRDNFIIDIEGRGQTVTDCAIEFGIKRATVMTRIKLGWSHYDALTLPIQPGKHLKRRVE